MKHFQNLRLQNLKGIKSCELRNLEKINVICGKNNSGKSTVLESIIKIDQKGKASNRIQGFNYNSQTLTQLYASADSLLISRGFQQTQINLLKGVLSNLCEVSEGIIFWEDNLSILISQILNKCQHKIYNLSQSHVAEMVNTLTSYTPRVQLIFAKRNPNIQSTMNTLLQLSYVGDGLINFLFNCKNSNIESDSSNFFNRLRAEFTEISSGYTFDLVFDKDSKTQNTISLRFSNDNKIWRSADDCGMGLRDLLVILTYAIENLNDVLLIEEPENHIHPDMQRKMLNFLKNSTDKQYIFTTHSNVFLDNAYVDKVYYCFIENDQIGINEATNKAFVLNQLGYSIADNLVSDLIILTEGIYDKPVIEEFLMQMGLIPKFNIKVWAMGGDIMDKQDLSVFVENHKVMALIDKDPGSKSIRDKLKSNCEEHKIYCHQLERYSIENYFTVEALRKVFHSQIPDVITTIDPKKKLEDQISVDVKRNNRKIVRQMKLEDVKDSDLFQFLRDVEKKLTL